MMTTNKLTKTFASGSLALGVLAGSVLAATSASAAPVFVGKLWKDWVAGSPLVLADGATATYVSQTPGFQFDPDNNGVRLTFSGDEYSFDYSVGTFGSPNTTVNGGFTYKITLPKTILGVSNDSDVSSTYKSVTTTFDKISNQLVSVNGAPDPLNGLEAALPATFSELFVTNLLASNPNEFLTSLSNGFEIDSPSVPEPGTILGLLAVGGLGMVSRFKKQK